MDTTIVEVKIGAHVFSNGYVTAEYVQRLLLLFSSYEGIKSQVFHDAIVEELNRLAKMEWTE